MFKVLEGGGKSSFHKDVSAGGKKTTKHCSAGGRVNYSWIFAFLRGFWTLHHPPPREKREMSALIFIIL